MRSNPVIETMLNRKSIRKYKPRMPTDETIHAVVRAGQQAPFASQLCSVLIQRVPKGTPFKAPLLFIICVDSHKWEMIMAKRDWAMDADDALLLLLGMQDAALMAANMVLAAESLGLGSCFLGGMPFNSEALIADFNLPERVFPLVGLTMGYPAENPPPRPRYPLDFVLFEDEYPQFTSEQVQAAMQVMDDGYLAQDYYKNLKVMIPLNGPRQETFDAETYSWTEHIARKWGQRRFPNSLRAHLKRYGFDFDRD